MVNIQQLLVFTLRSSSARMYIGIFEFFPTAALAVYWQVGDNAGTMRLLLPPHADCSIVNLKSTLSLMGPRNTDLISSNISDSVIEEYNLILPISPLLAISSRYLGIVTLPSTSIEFGRHTMSLSQTMFRLCFGDIVSTLLLFGTKLVGNNL